MVREAAKRVLAQRHYDVQVVGAGALHRGAIAEMKTGEGKTRSRPCRSTSTPSAATVSTWSPSTTTWRRDAEWMGGVHRFLGLTVGLIQAGLSPREPSPGVRRRHHLRDQQRVRVRLPAGQHGDAGRAHGATRHAFAIVDEVDSILVDEARTADHQRSGGRHRPLVPAVLDRRHAEADEHYEVDEAKRQVITTEEGVERVEKVLGVENMYDHPRSIWCTISMLLRAKELYQRDVDYLLDHGEVKIVDEFTGRVLEGRRYSEGLHQAIEPRRVAIKEENQTLATITLQNYFRLYDKLSGMTGTAKTEAAEFAQIYGLEVVEVPTHRTMVRLDQPDLVYKTEDAKFEAVVSDIVERHQRGQPVLAGTVSIEKSSASRLLHKQGDTARGPQRQAARQGGGDHRPGWSEWRRHRRHQHGGPWGGHHVGREPRRAGQDRAEAGGDRLVRPRLRGAAPRRHQPDLSRDRARP